MKPLYYLEFAQSVDAGGARIPAKNFKWFTPKNNQIAYNDYETCQLQRVMTQEYLTRWVCRVKKASVFENIKIRLSAPRTSSDWIIAD